MKKILLELICIICILSQLFVSITYFVVVFKNFSFDNLCILIAAVSGLIFTLKYINRN